MNYHNYYSILFPGLNPSPAYSRTRRSVRGQSRPDISRRLSDFLCQRASENRWWISERATRKKRICIRGRGQPLGDLAILGPLCRPFFGFRLIDNLGNSNVTFHTAESPALFLLYKHPHPGTPVGKKNIPPQVNLPLWLGVPTPRPPCSTGWLAEVP